MVADFECKSRPEGVRFLQDGGPDSQPGLAGHKSLIPKVATAR